MNDSTTPPPVRTGIAWYVRIPAKIAIFLLVVVFVCFPDPRLLVRQLGHLRNLDALIQPDDPGIRALADEFRARSARPKPTTTRPRDVQTAVERFVLDKVKYDWDWNLWGSADYVPTVREMFTAAAVRPTGELREDCDGRAVICASLLRALGYKSRIVTDLRHVWVETPEAALMGPGAKKTVTSTAHGNQVNLLATLDNIPRALSFGISVFPFWREFIIWLALVVLSIHPRMSRRAAVFGALLTLQGWLFIRCGVISKPDFRWLDQAWPGYVGLAHAGAGLIVLWLAASRARRAAPRTPTEAAHR